MQISAESFRRNIAESKARSQDEKDFETDWSTAQPAIMVCARYRLAGSKKAHHTIILFEVNHIDPSHLGVGWRSRGNELGSAQAGSNPFERPSHLKIGTSRPKPPGRSLSGPGGVCAIIPGATTLQSLLAAIKQDLKDAGQI
jgi:hypothetical protein